MHKLRIRSKRVTKKELLADIERLRSGMCRICSEFKELPDILFDASGNKYTKMYGEYGAIYQKNQNIDNQILSENKNTIRLSAELKEKLQL